MIRLYHAESVRHGRDEASRLATPRGSIISDFRALRATGYSAGSAMRTARILEEWRPLEDAGLVRALYACDPDPSCALEWLDQSADDMSSGNEREWAAVGKRERERANSDGVSGIIGQYRTSETEDWETCDSVCGFIGDDGLEAGGYAADIMASTLSGLRDAREDCCAACGRPRIGAA